MLGTSEIVLFNSILEEPQEHMGYLPVVCIAEPTKELDRKPGMEEGQGSTDSFTWHVSGLIL